MPFRIALVATLIALAAAGCGRRGDLQSPGSPEAGGAPAGTVATPPVPVEGTLPGDAQLQPTQRVKDAPNRPFVLDPLL